MKNRKATLTRFGSVTEILIEQESPLPELKPHEVLIKIEASTVSATDIFIRKGIYPLLNEKPPFTLGYDFVGRVEAVGPQVTRYAVGDRVADVCMTGGNADYIVRPENSVLKVRADIQAEQAACLVMTGMTAYQIFKSLQLQPGNRFLIHGGAGAIGSTLLQLCNLNGIEAVATGSATKLAFIEAQNAVAIDYNSADYVDQLNQKAGAGFDAALDFTNQKSFNNSFRLLRKGGQLITCAVFTSGKKIKKKTVFNFLAFGLDFGLMMLKLAIWNNLPNGKSASFFGILDSKKNDHNQYQMDFDELQQLVVNQQLNLAIHQVFSLTETAKAHQTLESGKATGFVVLKN